MRRGGRDRISVVIATVVWIAVILGIGLAQQAGQQTPPPQQDQSQQQNSQPLFKGKLGYKSSSTSKGSTTLGFNGIDPSGKVDQKMLSTNPSSTDQEKVKAMSANAPKPSELQKFVREGGLNSK